jgi:hypothetical protein
MANDLNQSLFFNPMALWTDLGMRALDTTVSTTQEISDRVDRVTRAAANAQVPEPAVSISAVSDRSASAVSSGLEMAANLQRSTFDLMTRGWLQWISALGNLASLAVDLGPGRSSSRRNLALDATRAALLPFGGLPFGGAESLGAQAESKSSSHRQSGRREAREIGSMEHAHAAAEPKRRRTTARAKPKARRSRRT